MARDRDPGREAARRALSSRSADSDLLIELMGYCWEQLCWTKTNAELETILATLGKDLDHG